MMQNRIRHGKIIKYREVNSHLKVTKILDIIEVLDVLLRAEIPQDIHITVCTLITSEYIMVRYDYNLFTVPNLQCQNNEVLFNHTENQKLINQL